MESKKRDLEIIKLVLQEAEDETEKVETFEDNPMEFILRKYTTLNAVMTELMTSSYREYLDAVFIVAPKPTTFKIVLHNGQFFYLTYLGKVYEATVAGKKYYLSNIGEKERCMLAISRILRGGNPLKSKGPEGAEQGTREGGEEGGGGGADTGGIPTGPASAEEGGGGEAGGGEEGGEELKENFLLESKIIEALLKVEAYTVFPKSSKEIKNKDIQKLYNTVRPFSDIDDPIALDPEAENNVNITRDLQDNADVIKAIKALTGQTLKRDNKIKWNGLNIKFGQGSRGGRGVKSKGLGFEKTLFEDLQKVYAEGFTKNNADTFTHPDLIKKIVDELELKKGNFKVAHDGSANKKRPIVFTAKGPIVSIPKGHNSVAEVVTDITIIKNSKAYYLSAKFGGTLTFFNSGVTTIFPAEEIKSGKIKNKDGLQLLETLGIDNKTFCAVFNYYGSKKASKFVPKQIKTKEDDLQNLQFDKLQNLVSSGIGFGYYYTQAGKGEDLFFKIDKAYNKKASTIIGEPIVYYGGIDGKSKRIDIIFETSKYIMKINIRNKQGGVYPSHIMCDYKAK